MLLRLGRLEVSFVEAVELDEALMALFIGAMDANGHVAREELARAHHLIWSTRRFRRKSGETVGRLIDRMKRFLEQHDRAAVMERAAKSFPARLRPSAHAIVAIFCWPTARSTLRSAGFCSVSPRVWASMLAVQLTSSMSCS